MPDESSLLEVKLRKAPVLLQLLWIASVMVSLMLIATFGIGGVIVMIPVWVKSWRAIMEPPSDAAE